MPNKTSSGSKVTPVIQNPPEATLTNPAPNSSPGGYTSSAYGTGYNNQQVQQPIVIPSDTPAQELYGILEQLWI